MLTSNDYFGKKITNPEVTPVIFARADEVLIPRVNKMLDAARWAGVYTDKIDPDTGTRVSGSKNGNGDGGFRLSSSTTGAKNSKHKQAQAVDIYDPDDALDDWLTDERLQEFGLYREHPKYTPGWCHLQSVSPPSGNRTFKPF